MEISNVMEISYAKAYLNKSRKSVWENSSYDETIFNEYFCWNYTNQDNIFRTSIVGNFVSWGVKVDASSTREACINRQSSNRVT